jgi:hypothetical protein
MTQSWYIFPTEALALQAEAEVSALIGCPLSNDAHERAKMMRWALPRETTNGSWAFEVPSEPAHQIGAVVVDSIEFKQPIMFPNTLREG